MHPNPKTGIWCSSGEDSDGDDHDHDDDGVDYQRHTPACVRQRQRKLWLWLYIWSSEAHPLPVQHHPVQHSQERHQRKHKVQNLFIITISFSRIVINHDYHPHYIAIIITSPPSKPSLLSNWKMFIIVLQFLSSVTFGNGCSHRTCSQPQLKNILFR